MQTHAHLKLTEWLPSEDELHTAVAALLYRLVKPPAAWTCIPTGQLYLREDQRARLTRAGVKPGWPDFIVVHRDCYGIELKRRGGRLNSAVQYRTKRGTLRERPSQAEVFGQLRDAGMMIAVCHTPEEVESTLRMWAIPLHGGLA